TLERQFPEIAGAQPELIAQHFTSAGMIDSAIAYWEKAGRLAVQRSTVSEAAAHFGKAVKLLVSLPKTPERASDELSLRLARPGALTAGEGWGSPEARDAYALARELCGEAPEGAQAAIALNGAYSVLHNHAEIRAAHQLAEEFAVLSEGRNDRETKLVTQKCL